MNYHTAKWSEVVQHEFGFDWNIPYNTPLPHPLPMPEAVVESSVQIETESGHLNCAVWSPKGEPIQRPLVLLGHSGAGHKKSPYLVWFAMRLVTDHDFVAAAIDHLPQHGDRGGIGDIRSSVDWKGASATFDEAIDSIVKDWQATIRTLVKRIEVDETKIGYWGHSGGTLMGIPLLAKTPGVSAAALGKWGIEGTDELKEIFRDEFPEGSKPTQKRRVTTQLCHSLLNKLWTTTCLRSRDRSICLTDLAHPERYCGVSPVIT